VREQITASARSFEERGFGHFAFWPSASPPEPDGLVGFAGLRGFGEQGDVELLYAIRPAHGGRGLATEAAGAVVRFGFEKAGLPEILAGADPPNAASFRVMARLGMSFLREVTIAGRPGRYYRLARGELRDLGSDSTTRIREAP
jgi:RimJ/RimL family protein N-acetyltransferase